MEDKKKVIEQLELVFNKVLNGIGCKVSLDKETFDVKLSNLNNKEIAPNENNSLNTSTGNKTYEYTGPKGEEICIEDNGILSIRFANGLKIEIKYSDSSQSKMAFEVYHGMKSGFVMSTSYVSPELGIISTSIVGSINEGDAKRDADTISVSIDQKKDEAIIDFYALNRNHTELPIGIDRFVETIRLTLNRVYYSGVEEVIKAYKLLEPTMIEWLNKYMDEKQKIDAQINDLTRKKEELTAEYNRTFANITLQIINLEAQKAALSVQRK